VKFSFSAEREEFQSNLRRFLAARPPRQIDPFINPAPHPVFAGIGNFRPRDRLRARDRGSLARS
jgi:hypothetical protein